MEGRFNFNNPFVSDQKDLRMMPENSDSPSLSGVINDGKNATLSSPKKSRRAVQKRVVSVPIGESRMKGEGAPPSDSWTWRKYGQKPIKGSPYPRGYYRCSSSKGCPARKQVERSRVDPTMLVITYACDHNHPWPVSKNSTATTTKSHSEESTVFAKQKETQLDNNFSDLADESLITTDDFGWFSYVTSTAPTILEESPICAERSHEDADVAMIFPMEEEDESLFADLGELPECSVVFRQGFIEQEEGLRRCSLRSAASSWCGSTG